MSQSTPQTPTPKRKRKKRRRISFIPAIICIVLMLGIIVFFSYYKKLQTLKSFDGNYTREIDITDSVITSAAIWLSDIEGISLSKDWLLSNTEPIVLSVNLTLTPSATGQGEYLIELNRDSYDKCVSQSYTLVSNCLKEVIANRLISAGYSDDLEKEEIDALILQICGMSLEEYLIDKELVLMDEYDSINSTYKDNGTYSVNENAFTWNSETKSLTEIYLLADDMFTLPNSNIIYRKQVEP